MKTQQIIREIKVEKRCKLNILLKQNNYYAKKLLHAYNMYVEEPDNFFNEQYLSIARNEAEHVLNDKENE